MFEYSTATTSQGIPEQVLLFHLGGETYGLPINAIREIIGISHLTKIPLAPPFLRGVMNLRGAVVPVVDLAVRFGGAATLLRHRSCVVIVEINNEQGTLPIGIFVDGVTEVRAAEDHDLEDQPAFGTGMRADFTARMLRRDQKFIPLLQLDAVLAQDELEKLVDASLPSRTSRADAVSPTTLPPL